MTDDVDDSDIWGDDTEDGGEDFTDSWNDLVEPQSEDTPAIYEGELEVEPPDNRYTVHELVKESMLSKSTVDKLITKHTPETFGRQGRFLLYGDLFLYELITHHKPKEPEEIQKEQQTNVSVEEFQILKGQVQILQKELKRTREQLEALERERRAQDNEEF